MLTLAFNGSVETINIEDIDYTASHQWLDIHDEPIAVVNKILQQFGIHPLAIQDAQRDRHPPKLDIFDDHYFLLYRGIQESTDYLDIKSTQISFFMCNGNLITCHKNLSLSISKVLSQFKRMRSPLDFLCQILKVSSLRYLDEVLLLDTELSDLEDRMLVSANDDDLTTLINYKAKLRRLKRLASYNEEAMMELAAVSDDQILFDGSELVFQDLLGKFERIHSLTSMYYDLCGDLIEGYLSLTSHKLNKTMQILTIITAIFVPLSFLAAVYGMNFVNIPELQLQYGYYILLGIMVTIGSTLFYIFKRNGWLD